MGPWFPEPLLDDPYEDPERSAELADSLSMAALVLLERLSPLERAVFVLREVFGFDFPEIASAVGRSEAACRQLAVRARRHMEEGRPRFEADRKEREELAERFFDAFTEGDVDALRELLAADVRMVGDGGGKAPQWKPISGLDKVTGILAAMATTLIRIGCTLQPHPGERPARRDRPRPRRPRGHHLGARRPRRSDPDDPGDHEPGQAQARRARRRRLGGVAGGEPGAAGRTGGRRHPWQSLTPTK